MTIETVRYLPINCEFHDLLESLATSRKPVHIDFRDEEGVVRHLVASMTDVFARDGAEYLSLGTGETLRLDRLMEVDGQKLADY
jgi:Rho-binding antiterminator